MLLAQERDRALVVGLKQVFADRCDYKLKGRRITGPSLSEELLRVLLIH